MTYCFLIIQEGWLLKSEGGAYHRGRGITTEGGVPDRDLRNLQQIGREDSAKRRKDRAN